MFAISVRGLRKSYGDQVVLDGIDLDVRRGTRVRTARPERRRQDDGRQHPQHAVRPDAGQVTVGDADLAENPDGVRRAIGVTGQFSAVDDLLTGEENLMLMADLHHLPRSTGRAQAAELLDRFELTGAGGEDPPPPTRAACAASSTWR